MILYDRIDKTLLSYAASSAFVKLYQDFLRHTKKVVFSPGLQGNRVDDNGIIYVGDRAGPSVEFEFLCHELAHFVEIDDQRMKMQGWGLKLPEQYVFGQRCIEPVTMQATAREIRVIAYQYNLLKYLGKKPSVRELVSSMKYMPDFSYVPLEDGLPAYVEDENGKYKSRLKYEKIDVSRTKWCAAEVKELVSEYTIDRFKSEWFRKINIL